MIPFVSVPKLVDDDNDKIIIIKGKIRIEFDTWIGYHSIEQLLWSLLCYVISQKSDNVYIAVGYTDMMKGIDGLDFLV